MGQYSVSCTDHVALTGAIVVRARSLVHVSLAFVDVCGSAFMRFNPTSEPGGASTWDCMQGLQLCS